MKHGEELINEVKKDIVNNCATESNHKKLIFILRKFKLNGILELTNFNSIPNKIFRIFFKRSVL